MFIIDRKKKRNLLNQRSLKAGGRRQLIDKVKSMGIIEIDTKIQLLPRKWYQIYKRGWQTHTDLFGRRYFVRYNWVK